jgi:ketosteroid isomerase-like protein
MSGNNDAEIAKIEELFAQWDAAVESSNLDGYVDGLDENITLMPPGGVVIKGNENYRKFLGPVFGLLFVTVYVADSDAYPRDFR